jgi:hypothetical protein
MKEVHRELDRMLAASVCENIHTNDYAGLFHFRFSRGLWMRNNRGLFIEELRLKQYFHGLGVNVINHSTK